MHQRAHRKPKTDRPASLAPVTAPVQRATAGRAPYHALPGSVGLALPNRTGLPDGLKTGLENLSGLSMDDVRVHRGSSRPGAIQAHAYTQGNDIHIGPGQERYLAHEAWHVVQQKQGRVAPTLDLGGTPVNDDAGLEREADAMGGKAEHAGNLASPATRTEPRQVAAPDRATAPIQGAWRIVMAGPKTQYFWIDEGEKGKRPDPPQEWSSYKQTNLDRRHVYLVGKQRPQRKKEPALDLAQWIIQYKGSVRAPSDHYNPFGRFKTAKVTSFVRSKTGLVSEEMGGDIRKSLAESDPTFQPPSKHYTSILEGFAKRDFPNKSFINRFGYPVAIATNQKKVLVFVSCNELGATYSDVIPEESRAVLDPNQMGLASDLEWAKGVDEPEFMDDMISSSSSDEVHVPEHVGIKQARSSKITPSTIKAWHGQKRSKQQAEVMGMSAGDAAKNGGFNPKEGKGWEWLHLIAHSMGGIEKLGPQVADNLVAGTSECNTQMIIVEEFLKDLVLKSGGTATLYVGVTMFDAARHIGNKISYDFVIQIKDKKWVYHWTFDCLSRTQPVVAENRQLRSASRVTYGLNSKEQEPVSDDDNN